MKSSYFDIRSSIQSLLFCQALNPEEKNRGWTRILTEDFRQNDLVTGGESMNDEV
jgi:hypothetical protein